MIEIKDKTNCCGCTACYSICPKRAINMDWDNEGFLYPKIDNAKCIDCHLCEKVCPYLNSERPETDLKATFAAINKSEKIRSYSSSGGMFALLASRILENSGVIYGAGFDDNYEVFHQCVGKVEDLRSIIGSKYMQSRLGNTFSDIKTLLIKGKTVLFVGTTCQVNGLRNFLRKDYSNLYCIDFICLGVPSPKIWSDYLETYFDKKKIKYINFKDKSLGWHAFSLRIDSEDNSFVRRGTETYFFTGYFRHLYTRPSCSNCVYKQGNRMSDITISDCWGAEHIAPALDDNKGMSSVVCQAEKGLDLFKSCSEQLITKVSSLDYILKYNSGYIKSSYESKNRDGFWKDYEKLPKKKLFKKYCTPDSKRLSFRIKRKLIKIKNRLLQR